MANTRELRRRIKSVKSTAQITKAMQMVAASKMKKAQNQALNGRPYNFNLNYALRRLLPLVNLESRPLLHGNDSKIKGIAVFSTDKGLCGALNTNLFRFLSTADFLSTDTIFYTVGKKGRNFIARTGRNLQADFENPDVVIFREALQLGKLLIDSFLSKEIGEAYLVYPKFISTLRQESTSLKILPIEYHELEKLVAVDQPEEKSENLGQEFLFEPDPNKLLDYLLLHFVRMKIYQSLLETKASEQSSRMIAMQNATDNASDLVSDLNLTYNQTRQDAITKELLEIVTAQVAMG